MWQEPDRRRTLGEDLRSLRRAWGFGRQYRGLLAVYMLMLAVTATVQILPALVVKRIIDDALPHHDSGELALLALALAGLFIVDSVLLVAGSYLSMTITQGIILGLRRALYDRIQRMPLAFFTRAQTGLLQGRLNWDVQQVDQLFTGTISSAVTDSLSLAFTLLAMLALDWRVTGVVLLLIPVALVPAEVVTRRVRTLNKERSQRWGAMNVATAERFNVAGALLVKLFGCYDADLADFGERIRRIVGLSVRINVTESLFTGALSLTGSLALVAIYWLGGLQVLAGALSLGTIVALATLAQRVYAPVIDLATTRVNLVSGLVGFERVTEVLDAPQAIKDRPAAKPLVEPRGEVVFEKVWFRYPAAADFSIASLEGDAAGQGVAALDPKPSEWILRDVSFETPAGSMTAVVGPTGGGKTTLCYLVPRLYDTTKGAVRVDGVDVRDLQLETLGRAVGMVTQDAHLFHDTIASNLRYARPDASDADLVRACQAAHIHELFASLPEGYDTIVGERGYRLSGGEKQRLAIARLLLKGPAIVILDEATSHLDSETELEVQRALAAALRDRTSFVVAHRLSTVRAADQILVLDGGRIVERGRHEQLVRSGGLYAELHETQFTMT
jgi:ATP-binding cassette subfamily B protein